MRILLVNVDNRWNLALRRLYTYYNTHGHFVELKDLGLSGYPHKNQVRIDASGFDRVHVSNIFEINAYRVEVIGCEDVDYGGIGSRNPENRLPDYVESCPPYYRPYEKTTYGFISRGCIRNCYFCKVPQHEGKIRAYNTIDEIVRGVPGEIVKFMDNNILALPEHLNVLHYLRDKGVRCQFNQGLDFRLINDENLAALAELKYFGPYTFAFDDIRYRPALDKKIKLIKKYIPQPWRVRFYIYYHPDMDIKTLFDRVKWCRDHECLPYVMRDAACWDSEVKNFLIDFAAYCNQPSMFKTKTFAEFMDIREVSKKRRAESLQFYERNTNQ